MIYYALNRDLNMRDKAELASQGLLELDEKFLILKIILLPMSCKIVRKHIVFQFLSFKPNDSIAAYK